MERWIGKVALVTGASKGIGMAIAKALVEAGMIVIGVGRQVELIQQKSIEYKKSGMTGRLEAMQCDISQAENVRSLFGAIKSDQNLKGVDVCVNNAGVAYPCSILSGDPDDMKKLMETNILGPAVVTQEAVKSMRERNVDEGHIIFINSLSGHRVPVNVKNLHMYSATKFAITAMVQGLRRELLDLGTSIRASAISPGIVDTDLIVQWVEGDMDKAHSICSGAKSLKIEDIAQTTLFILALPQSAQIDDILIRPTLQAT